MNRSSISLSDAIRFGIKQTIKHIVLWLGVWVTLFVTVLTFLTLWLGIINLRYALLDPILPGADTLLMTFSTVKVVEISTNILVGIIGLCIITWLDLGIIQMALDIYDHETTTYKRLFAVPSMVVARNIVFKILFGASFFILHTGLFLILSKLGLFLGVPVSILAALLLIFVNIILVHKHYTIIHAISLSAYLSSVALGRIVLLLFLFITVKVTAHLIFDMPFIMLVKTFKFNFFNFQLSQLNIRGLFGVASSFFNFCTIPLISPLMVLTGVHFYHQLLKYRGQE